VISWGTFLLVEDTGELGENHWPAVCHWQTLSHNVVWIRNHNVLVISTDCTSSRKSNHHTIMTFPPNDIGTAKMPTCLSIRMPPICRFIIEYHTVSLKCRTNRCIIVFFLYCNLCLSVQLDSLSCYLLSSLTKQWISHVHMHIVGGVGVVIAVIVW
jgi:hypothetical protein